MDTTLRSRPAGPGGFAYLLALLLVVVLGFFALSMQLLTQTDARVGANLEQTLSSRYLAESGVDFAVGRRLGSTAMEDLEIRREVRRDDLGAFVEVTESLRIEGAPPTRAACVYCPSDPTGRWTGEESDLEIEAVRSVEAQGGGVVELARARGEAQVLLTPMPPSSAEADPLGCGSPFALLGAVTAVTGSRPVRVWRSEGDDESGAVVCASLSVENSEASPSSGAEVVLRERPGDGVLWSLALLQTARPSVYPSDFDGDGVVERLYVGAGGSLLRVDAEVPLGSVPTAVLLLGSRQVELGPVVATGGSPQEGDPVVVAVVSERPTREGHLGDRAGLVVLVDDIAAGAEPVELDDLERLDDLTSRGERNLLVTPMTGHRKGWWLPLESGERAARLRLLPGGLLLVGAYLDPDPDPVSGSETSCLEGLDPRLIRILLTNGDAADGRSRRHSAGCIEDVVVVPVNRRGEETPAASALEGLDEIEERLRSLFDPACRFPSATHEVRPTVGEIRSAIVVARIPICIRRTGWVERY